MKHRLQEFEGWMRRLGGLLAAMYVRAWTNTVEFQAQHMDPSVDPVHPHFRGPVIAIFWHEYMLCPMATRGLTNTAILASLHRDADWLTEAARHLGFESVRGSSSRGGSAALLELLRANNDRNLGITPDGPRGPRRSLALGPIYLASKLGRPIVPIGIGYERPWRLTTWDRFAIPRLNSRARVIWGERIEVPPDLDRHTLESIRSEVQERLVRLTEHAETWAATGHRYPQQTRMRMQPVSSTHGRSQQIADFEPPRIRWRNPLEMIPPTH